MNELTSIMLRAKEIGICIPAFNVPYLPMVKPVIDAVVDEDAFALVEVARLEWEKFESGSLEAVKEEYDRWKQTDYVRLHLDHIPVIDEDHLEVDYQRYIRKAVAAGYDSVMVDGSRLPLSDNIAVTHQVASIAHEAGVPCEAELGAVLGHEEGPPVAYDELFRSGRGFTDPDEAERFVQESGCDWLSVAFGNIHGAVSTARRDEKKVQARLNLQHLAILAARTNIPLVLHGGSGITPEDVRASFGRGITKMNIGTEIRQTYEKALASGSGAEDARTSVYHKVRETISATLQLSGSRSRL